MNHVLLFGFDSQEMPFDLPSDPLEAAKLVALLLDEYTGNSLNYPEIMTSKEYEKFIEES